MEETPDVSAKQQRAQQGAVLVANTIRGMGAVFMLGGTAIGSNFHGCAETAGLLGNDLEKILGGVLFAVGLFDYFLLPCLLQRVAAKNKS